MKEHSVMMKYRNGLTDKLPAIRNGDLVYGRLSLQRSRYAADQTDYRPSQHQ